MILNCNCACIIGAICYTCTSFYFAPFSYFRVAVLPSSVDISCLFRTKVHPAMETILFNEIFRVAISQDALQQKTLRVDVCSVSKTRREECLVCIFFISFAWHAFVCFIPHWWIWVLEFCNARRRIQYHIWVVLIALMIKFLCNSTCIQYSVGWRQF